MNLRQLRSDLGRLASNVTAGIRSLQLDIDRMEAGTGDAAPADTEAAPPERTLEERVAELERKYPLLEDGVRIALGRMGEWMQSQFAALVFAPGVQRSPSAPSLDLTSQQMDPEAHANLEDVRAMRVAGQRPAPSESDSAAAGYADRFDQVQAQALEPDGSLVIKSQEVLGQRPAETSNEEALLAALEASDAQEEAQRALDEVRAARVAGMAETPTEAPAAPNDGEAGNTPEGV